MSKPPALRPIDRMEMRLMREAGATVKECADYQDVSIATAMRALADLRKRLGPENFKGQNARHLKQRARAYLYSSGQTASSQTATSQITSGRSGSQS